MGLESGPSSDSPPPFASFQTFRIPHLGCCGSLYPPSSLFPVPSIFCAQSFIPHTSSKVTSLLKMSNSSMHFSFLIVTFKAFCNLISTFLEINYSPLLYQLSYRRGGRLISTFLNWLHWAHPDHQAVRMLSAASNRNCHSSDTKTIISWYRKSPSMADFRLFQGLSDIGEELGSFHLPSRHHSQT